jgi:hypothetical protein
MKNALKSLGYLVLIIFTINCANAQRRIPDNLPFFEQKSLHFGFSLGVNVSSFIMDHNLSVYDTLTGIEIRPQTGFNIGIVSSLRLHRYFTLRFLPAISFAQRNFEYKFFDVDRYIINTRIVESTYIIFPLHIKYRSERFKNMAAYIVAGPNIGLDISSQADVDNDVPVDQQVLKVNRTNYMVDLGFGLDFFLVYFKLSTEVKLSVGANDVFNNDGSFWAPPINSLRPRMLTLSLHFEFRYWCGLGGAPA